MTYFNYEHIRGTHSEAVYAGSTILGRVAVKSDWRSRLSVSLNGVDLRYRAIGLAGEALPGLFLSRHDAAEALYEVAHGAPEPNGAAGINEA
jgi:aminopeptidase N